MASRIRFIMIGGFLGAGKTTAIAQLAASYQAEGKHVCIVTNDQAANLVDTHLLKSLGYDVSEVSGSCFCCNFNGLTSAMDEFKQRRRPDIILAEPVGSCTDLIATVAMPMMKMLNEEFDISRYAVILKPSHGLRILSGTGRGFSPKAEYIFRKQLEEADVLVINRIDELKAEQIQELEKLISEQYPEKSIVKLSARTGENLDRLREELRATAEPRTSAMEVDYDIYAEGEAELGWLNASLTLGGQQPFSLDKLAMDIVDGLRERLQADDAEPAHLKVICESSNNVSVANLVSSDTPAMLSHSSECEATVAEIIINARVATEPEVLEKHVRDLLDELDDSSDRGSQLHSLESFKPGRPVPTHRLA